MHSARKQIAAPSNNRNIKNTDVVMVCLLLILHSVSQYVSQIFCKIFHSVSVVDFEPVFVCCDVCRGSR